MITLKEVEDIIKRTGSTYVAEHLFKNKSDFLEHGIVCRLYNGEIYYTLKKYRDMEEKIAKNIMRLLYFRPCEKPDSEEIDRLIKDYEISESKKNGFEYHLDIEQKAAVHMALNNNVCIITGGPGTGKTSVLNCILYVYTTLYPENDSIYLSAPTGKAAQRINESSGYKASTIQRMLGTTEYEDEIGNLHGNLLNVDEASMLDTVTAYQLFSSITNNTKLILSGDIEQLPSVAPGAILRDLIESGHVPTTMLEKTFRQKAGSTLSDNIKYLKKGFSGLEGGDDFVVNSDFTNDSLSDEVLKTYVKAREIYGKEGVCLLTPNKRVGSICADVMNERLQDKLNSSSPGTFFTIEPNEENELKAPKLMEFRVGDPVMNLKNMSDEPIVNGQIGVVDQVNNKSIYVVFENGDTKDYDESEIQFLDLAYAMSVHKSQGSEYPCVIVAIPDGKNTLLNRNLIYTGVTRSKKKCIIFCKKSVLKEALSVEASYLRTTFLQREIKKAYLIQDMLKDFQ